jgi:hypothetical protein
MKLRKYEFTATQWATAKAKIETTNEEGEAIWDSAKVRQVVELGNLVKTPGTYDEEGNEVTAPVYSTKISVDILWENEPLTTSFSSYEVWCAPMGVHSMGGFEVGQEWIATCKKKKPELFPEPIDL